MLRSLVGSEMCIRDSCSSPPAIYLVGVWCCWVGAGPGCGDPGAAIWSGTSSSSDESGIEEDESMYTTKCLRARWFLGLAGSLRALGYLGALRAVLRGGRSGLVGGVSSVGAWGSCASCLESCQVCRSFSVRCLTLLTCTRIGFEVGVRRSLTFTGPTIANTFERLCNIFFEMFRAQ